MKLPSPYSIIQRYSSLHGPNITSLPVAILMPHSACNCRCKMCDIWKGNGNLKQLSENDIIGLLDSFKRLSTKRVVMSGGEALLNPFFFRFCEILIKQKINITLLSTGLTIQKNAENIIRYINQLILSLDGNPEIHDRIRDIPGAFRKLEQGVAYIRKIKPDFRITSRTVIHKSNFRVWPEIISTAFNAGIDQVSFLPADVSSHAFNRETAWGPEHQYEIVISREELPELKQIIKDLSGQFKTEFVNDFIAESPEKLMKIHSYYAAIHGINPFPFKKCNAPWVSAVIEPDGQVRPCFFHDAVGNIHQASIREIVNSSRAIAFRKNLNMEENETCKKCVCYLNLPPSKAV